MLLKTVKVDKSGHRTGTWTFFAPTGGFRIPSIKGRYPQRERDRDSEREEKESYIKRERGTELIEDREWKV